MFMFRNQKETFKKGSGNRDVAHIDWVGRAIRNKSFFILIPFCLEIGNLRNIHTFKCALWNY